MASSHSSSETNREPHCGKYGWTWGATCYVRHSHFVSEQHVEPCLVERLVDRDERTLAWLAQGGAAGGVKEGSLRERVRCPSLVDWPVYPRLRGTMQGSERARNSVQPIPQCGPPELWASRDPGGAAFLRHIQRGPHPRPGRRRRTLQSCGGEHGRPEV
jgi:hypothetical protein